jgi:hypothetical protein
MHPQVQPSCCSTKCFTAFSNLIHISLALMWPEKQVHWKAEYWLVLEPIDLQRTSKTFLRSASAKLQFNLPKTTNNTIVERSAAIAAMFPVLSTRQWSRYLAPWKFITLCYRDSHRNWQLSPIWRFSCIRVFHEVPGTGIRVPQVWSKLGMKRTRKKKLGRNLLLHPNWSSLVVLNFARLAPTTP